MTRLRVTCIQSILALSATGEVRLGTGGSPTVPFWSLVDQSGGPDACWPWTLGCDPAGYGQGSFGWTRKAHRQAYLLFHGSIDTSLDVCHTCDNPGCCNPAHLWLGTHQENLQDAGRKGRLGKNSGERNGARKLDWPRVRAIRAKHAEGASERSLGAEYGVSQVAIHYIVIGKHWIEKRPETAEAAA